MGTLTRAILRAEVLSNLGNIPDSGDTTTRINRLLDLAQLRIARAYDWKSQETIHVAAITTGTPAADQLFAFIPSGSPTPLIRKIHTAMRRVGTDTPFKLIRVPMRQWSQLGLGSESPLTLGAATHYLLRDSGTFTFYPTPDANWTLTIRYTTWPQPLANDNTASSLDFQDDMLIALTTHNAFQSLGQREDAVQWFAIYSEMLQSSIREEAEEPDMAILNRGLSERDSGVIIDPVSDPFVRRTV